MKSIRNGGTGWFHQKQVQFLIVHPCGLLVVICPNLSLVSRPMTHVYSGPRLTYLTQSSVRLVFRKLFSRCMCLTPGWSQSYTVGGSTQCYPQRGAWRSKVTADRWWGSISNVNNRARFRTRNRPKNANTMGVTCMRTYATTHRSSFNVRTVRWPGD